MILPLTRELSKAVVLALDLAGFITAVILRCIQLWQALSHRTRSGAARCSALGFLTGCPPGGQGPASGALTAAGSLYAGHLRQRIFLWRSGDKWEHEVAQVILESIGLTV